MRRGLDPAAPLRGHYGTALGAARHARRYGGFEAMARSLAAGVGLAETRDPRPGDIGLVDHPGAGLAFALRTELGWAVKAAGGTALGPFPARVAWRV